MTDTSSTNAAHAGNIDLAGDLTVHRLGCGAMRITGDGIRGEPALGASWPAAPGDTGEIPGCDARHRRWILQVADYSNKPEGGQHD
jgi:hypothetical protein